MITKPMQVMEYALPLIMLDVSSTSHDTKIFYVEFMAKHEAT
jgi:hypothetical protein